MPNLRPSLQFMLGLVVLVLLPGAAPAAAAVREWTVSLESAGSYERLVAAGFDVADVRPGHRAHVLADDPEADRLRALGFLPALADSNPGRTMAQRARRELGRGSGGRGRARVGSVPAFGAGSMGGYYTRAEIKAYLDSLIASDTHGIFSKVDTVGWSYRRQPILGVRVSGPAAGPKPRVFYNSVIHAREPEGMQNLLYFMGLLSSSYGADPDLTYLVDQRELYFVPIVNPDGYAVNESIYVSTGSFGFWRKNTRDNDNNGILNTQDGVDLNRNFGFKWGFDNTGSSNQRTSDVYRGPSAFSEAETKAMRHYCDSLAFVTGINYHTYSDLEIIPFGYSNVIVPDSAMYYEWVDDFSTDNHYTYGISPRILYAANGVADDWMYGEAVEKPRMYSLTIEVGNQDDGFYPAPSRILPLAAEQVRSNMGVAYAAGRFLRIQGPATVSGDGFIHAGQRSLLTFSLKNRGLTQSSVGALTATLLASDSRSVVLAPSSVYPVIAPGATSAASDTGFVIYVPPTTPAGTVLNFKVLFADEGGYSGTDSFQVLVGMPTTIFSDQAETGMANWIAGTWNVTTAQSVSPTHSLTDSPAGYYAANSNNSMISAASYDLTALENLYLAFSTRWDMEADYDAGFVEVSTDSGLTWTPLPGRYTNPGVGNSGGFNGGVQPLGAPIYDALKYQFVPERINLSAYCGAGQPRIRFRFRLRADSGAQRDGWYVDDVRLVTYTDLPPPVGVGPPGTAALRLGFPHPNPARGECRIAYQLPASGRVGAAIYDVSGRRIRNLLASLRPPGAGELSWDGRDESGRRSPAGLYFLRFTLGSDVQVRRIALLGRD